MKKTIFTLYLNDYAPEMVKLTFPLMQRWADKIGADFHIIKERRWVDAPITYEKFQIYYLAKEIGSDWNIFFDADTLVHPDLGDVTSMIDKSTTMQNGKDIAVNRWSYDEYFWRDGRHTSSCNWFAVASDWCLDFWHPLEDISMEEALSRIHPNQAEVSAGVTPEHLIDDYVISRNIARYGLRFTTLERELNRLEDFRQGEANVSNIRSYLWHQYAMPDSEKILRMKTMLAIGWKIPGLVDISELEGIDLPWPSVVGGGQRGRRN
jgi:hypothetical protein